MSLVEMLLSFLFFGLVSIISKDFFYCFYIHLFCVRACVRGQLVGFSSPPPMWVFGG